MNEPLSPQAVGPPAAYVQLLLQVQGRLFAYIASVMGGVAEVDDILQEANLVLLRKWREFAADADFGAWSCRVAYYQCLAHRRKLSRDKLCFDEALVRDIAAQAEVFGEAHADRRKAIRGCLEEISAANRGLLQRRYASNESLQALAAELGRPVGSLYQTLYRIRAALAACMERRISGASVSGSLGAPG